MIAFDQRAVGIVTGLVPGHINSAAQRGHAAELVAARCEMAVAQRGIDAGVADQHLYRAAGTEADSGCAAFHLPGGFDVHDRQAIEDACLAAAGNTGHRAGFGVDDRFAANDDGRAFTNRHARFGDPQRAVCFEVQAAGEAAGDRVSLCFSGIGGNATERDRGDQRAFGSGPPGAGTGTNDVRIHVSSCEG